MYGINRLTCIPDSTAKIQTSLQTKNNSLSIFLPFAHSFVLCTRYDFQLQSYNFIFNYKTIGRKNLAFVLPMCFIHLYIIRADSTDPCSLLFQHLLDFLHHRFHAIPAAVPTLTSASWHTAA